MSTAINVPIKARTHELSQLHDWLPQLSSVLADVGLTDKAGEVARIYDKHVSDVEATYPENDSFAAWVSMPADDWSTVISDLRRLKPEVGLAVWWLRKKLAQRLSDRLEEVKN